MYLLALLLLESNVEVESEPRKLPVPVIICQLPTLKEEEDSCRCRRRLETGTVTGLVRRFWGDQAPTGIWEA